MITGADSRKKWNEWDRLVMEAYQIHENEKCPKCGNARWICGSPNGHIRFKIRSEFCEATFRVNDWRDIEAKRDQKGLEATIAYAEPYTTEEGRDLSFYRDEYYLERAKIREADQTPS